jgi:DNA-binding response OmpR family regulator
MTERILIAEDDPAIADSVGYSLRACGYHVDVVGSGEAVLESGPGSYDLLILDVMLPGLSGVEVCRRVRERSAVPVLMLTALAGEADRVVGLEAGADDYLGKPFSMAEMVSRVRAILRRRRLDRQPDAVRQVGGLYLDLAGQAADRRESHRADPVGVPGAGHAGGRAWAGVHPAGDRAAAWPRCRGC